MARVLGRFRGWKTHAPGEIRQLSPGAPGGEGVKSLLPQTDLVILGRRDTNTSAVVVPWRDVVRICGRDMQATEDAPPRFRVDSFPVDEWREIESIGRKLTL